jgi:hypothetical protein
LRNVYTDGSVRLPRIRDNEILPGVRSFLNCGSSDGTVLMVDMDGEGHRGKVREGVRMGRKMEQLREIERDLTWFCDCKCTSVEGARYLGGYVLFSCISFGLQWAGEPYRCAVGNEEIP